MPTSSADPTRLLRQFALFLLSFSAIFWVWAIINTATKNYVDLGILSFLTVIITSASLLCIVPKGPSDPIDRNCCRKLWLYGLTPLSHGLVIANYALGANVMEHAWGVIYCSIFTVLWIVFVGTYLVLLHKIQRASNVGGDIVEEDGDNNDAVEKEII